MLADSVSGRIRSDFFASIASKDLSFFDRVNVGEISKFNTPAHSCSGTTKLRHTSDKPSDEQQFQHSYQGTNLYIFSNGISALVVTLASWSSPWWTSHFDFCGRFLAKNNQQTKHIIPRRKVQVGLAK